MTKFKRHQSIVERHYGRGTIAYRIFMRHYMAYFIKNGFHIVKEKNLHKLNKTPGEIS